MKITRKQLRRLIKETIDQDKWREFYKSEYENVPGGGGEKLHQRLNKPSKREPGYGHDPEGYDYEAEEQMRQRLGSRTQMDVTVGTGPGVRADTNTETEISLDLSRIRNIDIKGIDMSDHPRYVDAFVDSAEYEYTPNKFRDLTEDELDYLNNNESDWLYQQVWEQVY